MPGFERAIAIDRPPSQVFAVLDDVQNAKLWIPGIRRIEVVTPDNAVDIGYKWRETRAVMGIFRMTLPVEIVRHDKDEAWGIVVDNGKMRATATFELKREGQHTLVTLREDVEDLQGSAKRAARLARMMEKVDADLLLRLKAYVEAQPAPAAPPPPPMVKDYRPTKVAKPAKATIAKAGKDAKGKPAKAR